MENKKWLIDVEYYKNVLEGFKGHLLEFGKVEAAECVTTIIKGLKLVPTVDAVEVVHGRWLPMYNVDWIYGKEWLTDYICTQCGGLNKKKSPYCPNCGSRMDGGN